MRNINQFRNVRSAKENLRKWIQEVIAMDNDAPVMRKTSNKKLPACGERVDNLLFSVLTRRFATNKEECNSLVMKQLVLCLLIANKPTTGNDVVADMNNLYNSSWARRFCIRNLLPTTFANVRISNVPLSLEELNSALLIVNVRLSNESIQYVMRFVTRLDVEQTIKAPQENMQCSESVISTNLQDDSDLSEEFCISLEADMTQEQPSSHHMQDGAMSAKSFIENYLLDMFHGRQVVTFTPTNSSCSTVKRRSIYSAYCDGRAAQDQPITTAALLLQKRVWTSLVSDAQSAQSNKDDEEVMVETDRSVLEYFHDINTRHPVLTAEFLEMNKRRSAHVFDEEILFEEFISAYTLDDPDETQVEYTEVPCNELLELMRLSTLTSTKLYVYWFRCDDEAKLRFHHSEILGGEKSESDMHLVCFEEQFVRCDVEKMSNVLMREQNSVKVINSSRDIWSVIALCLVKFRENYPVYATDYYFDTITTGESLKQQVCCNILYIAADVNEEACDFVGNITLSAFFCNTNDLPLNQQSKEVMKKAYSQRELRLDDFCGLLPLHIICGRFNLIIFIRGLPAYEQLYDPVYTSVTDGVAVKHDSWEQFESFYDPEVDYDSYGAPILHETLCLHLIHDSPDFDGVKNGRWTRKTQWVGGISTIYRK